jgi:predicted NBD/HSP70 family sugar kinase
VLGEAHDDPRLREAVRLGHGVVRVRDLIAEGDVGLSATAGRAGAALGVAIANLVGLFAPPRVVLVGATLRIGDPLLTPLRRTFAEALPPPLRSVAEIVVGEAGDELWARGAAAVALGELYGARWGMTGPARRLSAADTD